MLITNKQQHYYNNDNHTTFTEWLKLETWLCRLQAVNMRWWFCWSVQCLPLYWYDITAIFFSFSFSSVVLVQCSAWIHWSASLYFHSSLAALSLFYTTATWGTEGAVHPNFLWHLFTITDLIVTKWWGVNGWYIKFGWIISKTPPLPF